MAVQFKLTKTNGLTRRITFKTRPTWFFLSARIAVVYDIPTDNVGVSYVDSEGDEVFLSSDDELQDFYSSLPASSDSVIKLAVHDLSVLRAANRSLPSATPQQPQFRNTFGGHEVLPIVFDTEDEWQRLPGNLGSLFLSRDASESPHAFVEVLESDVSASRSEAAKSEDRDTSHSDLTFTLADKGKRRAVTVDDDVSSAGSVIGNETPAKPPVHVLDMNSEDVSEPSPRSTAGLLQSGVTPVQAQSTPVITEPQLEADVSISTGERKTEVLDDDPPLPSLPSANNPDHAHPSLADDIATLLATVSTIIATHPELSERLRNIVVNATNGTYWVAHREAISRAAENIHRTAVQETGRSLEEIRRVTEQEAGARVTDALGNIFRTIGGFSQDAQENAGSQAFSNTTQVPPGETSSDTPRPPSHAVPTPTIFPHLPPHPRRNHHSWFSQPPFAPPGGPFWGGLPHSPPPPPPPPPVIPRGWPRPPPPRFWGRDSRQVDVPANSQDARAAAAEVLATAAEARARVAAERAQTTTVQPSSTPKATPEDLRAEVERAKADYKVRKERYRQAKAIRKMAEQRRHDQASTTESQSLSRQTSDNPTQVTSDSNEPAIASTPTPEHQASEPLAASEVQIVSNARGPYPQLEMFSVPRRSHTIGHTHRGPVPENKENRHLNRIMRKLSDMGFTEGTYPNLTAKVMDQLLAHPPMTKDAEEDIVTNLIEELIPSGGGTRATGFGGIPGAWH